MKIITYDNGYDQPLNFTWNRNTKFLILLGKIKFIQKKWEYLNLDEIWDFKFEDKVKEIDHKVVNVQESLYHQIRFLTIRKNRSKIVIKRSDIETLIAQSQLFASKVGFSNTESHMEIFRNVERKHLEKYNRKFYEKVQSEISNIVKNLHQYKIEEGKGSIMIEELLSMDLNRLIGVLIQTRYASMIGSSLSWSFGDKSKQFLIEKFGEKIELFFFKLCFYETRGVLIDLFLTLESISDIPTHPILIRFFNYLKDDYDLESIYRGKIDKNNRKSRKFKKLEIMVNDPFAKSMMIYLIYHYKIDPLALKFVREFVIYKLTEVRPDNEENRDLEEILRLAVKHWRPDEVREEVTKFFTEKNGYRKLYVNYQIPMSLRKVLLSINGAKLWKIWCQLVSNDEVLEFMSFKGTRILVYKLLNKNFREGKAFLNTGDEGNNNETPIEFEMLDHINYLKYLLIKDYNGFVKKIRDPYVVNKLVKHNSTIEIENDLFSLMRKKEKDFVNEIDSDIAQVIIEDLILFQNTGKN